MSDAQFLINPILLGEEFPLLLVRVEVFVAF